MSNIHLNQNLLDCGFTNLGDNKFLVKIKTFIRIKPEFEKKLEDAAENIKIECLNALRSGDQRPSATGTSFEAAQNTTKEEENAKSVKHQTPLNTTNAYKVKIALDKVNSQIFNRLKFFLKKEKVAQIVKDEVSSKLGKGGIIDWNFDSTNNTFEVVFEAAPTDCNESNLRNIFFECLDFLIYIKEYKFPFTKYKSNAQLLKYYLKILNEEFVDQNKEYDAFFTNNYETICICSLDGELVLKQKSDFSAQNDDAEVRYDRIMQFIPELTEFIDYYNNIDPSCSLTIISLRATGPLLNCLFFKAFYDLYIKYNIKKQWIFYEKEHFSLIYDNRDSIKSIISEVFKKENIIQSLTFTSKECSIKLVVYGNEIKLATATDLLNKEISKLLKKSIKTYNNPVVCDEDI